jgi:hypothetical protein
LRSQTHEAGRSIPYSKKWHHQGNTVCADKRCRMPFLSNDPEETPPTLQELEGAYEFSYPPRHANSSSRPWLSVDADKKVTY